MKDASCLYDGALSAANSKRCCELHGQRNDKGKHDPETFIFCEEWLTMAYLRKYIHLLTLSLQELKFNVILGKQNHSMPVKEQLPVMMIHLFFMGLMSLRTVRLRLFIIP